MLLTVEIPVSELVDKLTDGTDNDTVMQLIKGLDRAMADYEFTLELTKYLVKELKAESDLAGEAFSFSELE